MAIDPLTPANPANTVAPVVKSAEPGTAAAGFADTLGRLVQGVEASSSEANTAVAGMLNKTVDVHDAMIALQRAEMSLQLTVQVRNKLVQAYQDIMRMPV